MIGVYDSGFGGLTVLLHLRRALPSHDFTYLGDSGRAPYGGRDVGTILDFAEQAKMKLLDPSSKEEPTEMSGRWKIQVNR